MSDPTEERRRPVCAIAGVGPGNGEAFARRFAAEGYSVALLARNKERLETLAGELPEARAFRLFACGAILPRLEIAIRRARHGLKRKTSDMNDEFAS
jgi:NAD(P)-dependent dehydrogenase (short-subunit alcohol dehydrogenase family)